MVDESEELTTSQNVALLIGVVIVMFTPFFGLGVLRMGEFWRRRRVYMYRWFRV